MRRIDVIAIGIGVFAAGGALYLFFQAVGLDNLSAGIWSQALLVAGLVGWTLTYLLRVLTKNMTYNQQRKDYEDAMLQKRLDEMSPEELEQLLSQVEQEKQAKAQNKS
jgi:peroxiredoxin family protein